MSSVNCSNMTFASNLQPIGEEEFRDSVFLTKIRDPFALDYMHRQKFKMLPVQEEEYRKASGHCSYAFDKDYPWGTIIDAEGNEKLTCKCLNMQCSQFGLCNPDFELGDLAVLFENEINAFLKYSNDSQKRRERQNHRGTIRTKELLDAYQHVLSESAEEKQEDEARLETIQVSADEIQIEALPSIPQADEKIECFAGDAFEETEQEEETDAATALVSGEFTKFVHAEYDDILNAGSQERMLINAGPGTGKTWTLIHKIVSLVNNPCINPENVLVLSFSRAAVEEIEKRLKEAEKKGELSPRWHAIDFSTLDSFATRVILWVIQNQPDLLPDGYSLVGQGYDERIETARSILKKKKDILESNIHVLVDEIQDLVGCRASFVLDILQILDPECGFTLLGDFCQALYDYQAGKDRDFMTSKQFYDTLFRHFPQIGYYRFDENHRQSEWLRELIAPYRDAILIGQPADRRKIVDDILKKIMDSFIDLRDPDQKKIDLLLESGSVAILTRSNGEALKISEYLKSAGINHRLERPDSEEQLNDWIAAVFSQYPNETINRELFVQTVEKVQPDLRGAHIESCWNALLENVQEDGPWYHVSNILETLIRRGKNRALFRYGHDETKLTVSNIHRAKGKEYETVLVPEYSMNGLLVREKEDINEHKVCYVACTRPKTNLKTARMKKVYVSRERRSGRCFEGRFKHGRTGQRFLACLEVGLPGDIDLLSLASADIQQYVREVMKQDDRLVLIREIIDDKARYLICPENDREKILGYMSTSFTEEVDRIKRILAYRKKRFDPKYYPHEMDNIIVTKKTTCIATGEQKKDGMKCYGDVGIWYGFSITGFAHMIYDRY